MNFRLDSEDIAFGLLQCFGITMFALTIPVVIGVICTSPSIPKWLVVVSWVCVVLAALCLYLLIKPLIKPVWRNK